jgi:hypothetical protein
MKPITSQAYHTRQDLRKKHHQADKWFQLASDVSPENVSPRLDMRFSSARRDRSDAKFTALDSSLEGNIVAHHEGYS